MKHWIMKVQESQGHVISDRRIINGPTFFKECKLSNCMLVLLLEIAQLDWSGLQSRAWYSSGMKTLSVHHLPEIELFIILSVPMSCAAQQSCRQV